MNPGKVVDPYRLDENLRLGRRLRAQGRCPTLFALPATTGAASRGAASRCVGIGKCRGDAGRGHVPVSYRVTREEEHATRGRARLLMEMVRGTSRSDHRRLALGRRSRTRSICAWRARAASKECPVDVDMATYKAEFLAHHYAGRLRPRPRTTRWAGSPLLSAAGFAARRAW